jgi:hypothetical protein
LFSADKGLLDFSTRQCLILTDNTFVSAVSKLWLSRVYVRLKEPVAERAILFAANGAPLEWAKPLFVQAKGAAGGLWMTDVTLQGDGAREVQGIDATVAMAAEGSASHLFLALVIVSCNPSRFSKSPGS